MCTTVQPAPGQLYNDRGYNSVVQNCYIYITDSYKVAKIARAQISCQLCHYVTKQNTATVNLRLWNARFTNMRSHQSSKFQKGCLLTPEDFMVTSKADKDYFGSPVHTTY